MPNFQENKVLSAKIKELIKEHEIELACFTENMGNEPDHKAGLLSPEPFVDYIG